MFDALDNIKQYGSISLVIISILAIFMSGIFFGITYYVMDITENSFKSTDCIIKDNIFVGSCQDLWKLSVYPFLALREILIWFSYFFIFSLVLGMLIVGYQAGKSPVLLGLLMVFVLVMTYIGIEISNIYRTMLEVDTFRIIMADFTIYNNIMIKFPWFTFFVGLLSVMLSVVNYQKIFVNKDKALLNY
jgi:hypothetical protein